jgi:hypothetical protein
MVLRAALVRRGIADTSAQREERQEMKTIMTGVLGLTLLAGAGALPASAADTVTISASEYNRLMRLERKKQRAYAERQIEYDANALPIGTSIWWQQMDREQRGGRR